MGFAINPPNSAFVDKNGLITTEWYRFLANLQRILGDDVVQKIQQSSILTYAPSEVLTDERVLIGGDALTLTIDASLATMDLDDTTVVPGSYGDASHFVTATIDAKGRITDAAIVELDTDNVTEGSANLFFTEARARAAISAASPLGYNNITGVLSFTGVLDAPHGGTGLSSYAVGDLVYASGTTALSSLAVGSANYVLGSNGTIPTWVGNSGTGNVVRVALPSFTTTIGVGAAAASASGSGVTFPAAQSASTDPNTLDDYEEGTWTPTVTAASGTITTATASGYYTKIGRQVDATLTINITTNGTGASLVNATLPFAAASGPAWVGAGRESASTGNMLQAIVSSGASIVSIATYANAYPGGSGTVLTVSVSYFV